MNAKEDWRFLSTETLLEEVLGRYDHAVFAGLVTGRGDGSQQAIRRKWKGNHATCAGLGFSVSYAILNVHFEQSQEGRLDEDH